jgi:hypothetical protein
MNFKIVTIQERQHVFSRNVQLDRSRCTAILIRQSKRGSDAEHYESRLLQESLIPFVMSAREEDDLEHVHIFDEGAGVSGRLGIDKRKKLRSMMEEIVGNVIGDIVLARADRLFRDKHFSSVSTFTELAERMGIKVIIPQTVGAIVYDFRRYEDLQAFQKAMQEAYAYINNQIGYMNRARDSKKARGLYGGGCIPLPYVLVRDMPKETQVQVIYEPWVEASLDLFKKFKEFNFESGRIARYVEEKSYIFPFMPPEHTLEYVPVTNMHRTPDGYTFTQVKTILYYLSNLVLAGYAHGGKDENGTPILIQGVFDPVVPIDLFEPCYAAIGGQYLDGTPFIKPQTSRQYRRQGIETDAILHGLLTSDDGSMSIYAQVDDAYPMYGCLKGGYFGQKNRVGINRQQKAWQLPVKALDAIVLDRLIALAEHDPKISEKVQAFFASASQEGESTLTVLDTAIRNTKKALRRVSLLLVAITKKGGEEDQQEEEEEGAIELDPNDPLVKEHRQLQADLRRLIRQREEAARLTLEDPAKSITNFYHTLSHLRTEFHTRKPQDKKDIMRKLIERIQVNTISPHLYTLNITWIRPLTDGRDDVALLWRSDPTKDEALTRWSAQEEETLRAYYPNSTQLVLMQALPNKTPGQMKKRAWELGIRRDYRHIDQTGRFTWTVCYKDLLALEAFVTNAEEREYVQREVNTLAENTKRGQLSALWFIPVDMLAFSRLVSVTDVIETGLSQHTS